MLALLEGVQQNMLSGKALGAAHDKLAFPPNVFRKSLLQLFREWPLRSRHSDFASSMNSALVRAMWHRLLASATAARAVSSSVKKKKKVSDQDA